MYRTFFLAIIVTVIATGCGRSAPLVSGGKTPDEWIEALQDENVTVRVEAVKKLGNIGDRDRNALPAVYLALTDESPIVRKEVIFAIVRNWPASRDALPQLEEVKETDKDAEIRKLAEEAYHNLSLKK